MRLGQGNNKAWFQLQQVSTNLFAGADLDELLNSVPCQDRYCDSQTKKQWVTLNAIQTMHYLLAVQSGHDLSEKSSDPFQSRNSSLHEIATIYSIV